MHACMHIYCAFDTWPHKVVKYRVSTLVLLNHVGEAPSDPSIGFLPPNNGTSGQGFVTFSVSVADDASNLATIDAEASIVFDANEPIDTPPIFNTVSKIGISEYYTI